MPPSLACLRVFLKNMTDWQADKLSGHSLAASERYQAVVSLLGQCVGPWTIFETFLGDLAVELGRPGIQRRPRGPLLGYVLGGLQGPSLPMTVPFVAA